MAKRDYRKLEDKVLEVFQQRGEFYYEGARYKVAICGKPYPESGECKTDVYITGTSRDYKDVELKISVKIRDSSEFQENKVNPSRAEDFFGTGWQKIIMDAGKKIKGKFHKTPLIFASRSHPTQPNSITLGWKLEIADKERALSSRIPLSNKEIREYIYKGANLPPNKRNAHVNGNFIRDAGVAQFILRSEINEINSTEHVISNMEHIDIATIGETYLIFTANNYRTKVDKADGNRHLAVKVIWGYDYDNEKLTHRIDFNDPLVQTGQGSMKPLLIEALKGLGKFHPSDMDINDIADPSIFRK